MKRGVPASPVRVLGVAEKNGGESAKAAAEAVLP